MLRQRRPEDAAAGSICFTVEEHVIKVSIVLDPYGIGVNTYQIHASCWLFLMSDGS